LTIIPLTHFRRNGFDGRDNGQAKRAHGQILAQRAKVPQLMATVIFKERNPCKHWLKRAPGTLLSSMLYLTIVQKAGFFTARPRHLERGEDVLFCHIERNRTSVVQTAMKKYKGCERWKKVWRENKSLLITIIILTAVRSAIADWNDVPTGSMNPTIVQGDRVFVNKLAYDLKVPFTTWHLTQWSNPKRGDIVVFFSPGDGTRLVKRVVGLPGDQIELANERLLINGRPLQYDLLPADTGHDVPPDKDGLRVYAEEKAGGMPSHPVTILPQRLALRTFGPVTVPTEKYFVMGDNRDNSNDSRFWGTVDRNRIVGRATMVVISLDREHYFEPRWHRFFTGLL
jgi:signal peptidase I